MKLTLAVLICTLLLVPAGAHARTWLVRQGGSGDCTTIQACIDSAGSGDTVLVGPGLFLEELVIDNSKGDLAITSELGPASTRLEPPASSFPAVTFTNTSGQNLLEGFTIAHFYSFTGPGGGIRCGGTSLTIRGNVIFDCSSSGLEGSGGSGGAIGMFFSSGTIEQNTVFACRVGFAGAGGGICLYYSPDVVIDRNIIASCTEEGIFGGSIPTSITCNNVWNNLPANYGGAIPDQTGTNGNISVDPLFCDAAAEDFYLRAGSPCLNAPACGLIGALGEGCMPTGVEMETTWGRIKVLFR